MRHYHHPHLYRWIVLAFVARFLARLGDGSLFCGLGVAGALAFAATGLVGLEWGSVLGSMAVFGAIVLWALVD